MFSKVANKNGTIEVEGNTFRFRQPADEYETDDTTRIEESYTTKMDYIAGDPHYITAQDIENQHGQIIMEFDLTDLKMFDYLRTLFLEEKIYYYQSLLEIAKRDEANDVNVLWQKENFVADPQEKSMKCMITEHDDFNLYKQKDTVTSVKELIILSLTSMNRVLGKPRRSDFLEQKEEVIHFAEKLYLKAKTIDDIEEFINSEIYHLEMRQREKESTPKQGKLAALRERFTSKTPADQKSREMMISNLKNDSSNGHNEGKEKPKNTNKDKKTILWTFGGIAGAVVLSFALNTANESANAEDQAKAKMEETEQMISFYRDSFFEEPDVTITKMEEIGYENLSDNDKNVLNQLYIDIGDYEKALQNDPNVEEDIAKSMYQKGESQALEEFVNGLEEETPATSFYLASDNESWEQVLQLKETLTLDHEQANIVITAFLNQDNVAGAETFLETIESPTQNMQERVNNAIENQEN